MPKLARLAYYKYRSANLTFGFNTHVIRARVRVRGWTCGFNTHVTARLCPNPNPDTDPNPHRIGRPSPTLT